MLSSHDIHTILVAKISKFRSSDNILYYHAHFYVNTTHLMQHKLNLYLKLFHFFTNIRYIYLSIIVITDLYLSSTTGMHGMEQCYI